MPFYWPRSVLRDAPVLLLFNAQLGYDPLVELTITSETGMLPVTLRGDDLRPVGAIYTRAPLKEGPQRFSLSGRTAVGCTATVGPFEVQVTR